MLKRIYEHLITRTKYNTLMNNYNVLKEMYDEKTIELNTQMSINKIEHQKFIESLNDLTRTTKKEKKNKKESKNGK